MNNFETIKFEPILNDFQWESNSMNSKDEPRAKMNEITINQKKSRTIPPKLAFIYKNTSFCSTIWSYISFHFLFHVSSVCTGKWNPDIVYAKFGLHESPRNPNKWWRQKTIQRFAIRFIFLFFIQRWIK